MKPGNSDGFTLLEIVVSLAIAALAIAAVAKATGSAAATAAETRERVLAVWVASNRLAELRIARAWPIPGGYESERTMGGRTWYLSETVQKTELATLRRVGIEVYLEPNRQRFEYRSFGYIARDQSRQDPSGNGGGATGSGQQARQQDGRAPGDGPQPRVFR